MSRLVYTLRVCTLGSVPGPTPTARPTKHFDPSLLACQESVGKMSPVRLLLVNVLDLTTSASWAPRHHSRARWPLAPRPRFLSLGSACCPTWGPRSLPRVPGPRRRGSPPPGVFVPLLFYRQDSSRALWFSCPRRAPGPPGPPLPAAGNPPRTRLDSAYAVGYLSGLVNQAGIGVPAARSGRGGRRRPIAFCTGRQPSSHHP